MEKSLEKYRALKESFSSGTSDISAILSQINLTETKYKSRFLVKQGDKMLSIRTEDIACFHSKHGIVHIHTRAEKTYLSDFTLEDLIEQLDPLSFYRANRQFIVNADFISVVHKHFKGKLLIELAHFTGDQILVSTEKATSFKQWLDQ